jgi:hypothetical protein
MDDDQQPQSPNEPEWREPDWLHEFQEMANRELGEGSACDQVHPVIEKWYQQLMQKEPPESRDAVMQAMSCLSTEILYNSPQDVLDAVLEHVNEDTLATWIEYVLMIGRAFEISLSKGELDDL